MAKMEVNGAGAVAAIHAALERQYGTYGRARQRVEEIANRINRVGAAMSAEDPTVLAALVACVETFTAQAAFLPPELNVAIHDYAEALFLLGRDEAPATH